MNKVKSVVNVRKSELNKQGYDDFEEWHTDKNHIYIGRDMSFYVKGAKCSIWHNPYPVKKPNKVYKNNKKHYTLDESLQLFREYVENSQTLLNRLCELNGKVLGCWCRPGRCHGDVLAELVEKYCND